MTFDEKTVVVKDLSKRYGKNDSLAIKNINFECKQGEIVGLLGKNGAGKSTTIKCLTGFLPFEEGKISIAGNDIVANPIAAKMNFGYVPDNRNVFEKMTGLEYIYFMADAYKVEEKDRKERIEEFQKAFNLGDKIYNIISSYSHGMKQKVCIMGSLIHNPVLWILDEPLTGLDPQTTRALREYMVEYKRKGKTVLFSSHNLDAVEKICDRVIIISNGELVASTAIADFKKENADINLEEFFIQRY